MRSFRIAAATFAAALFLAAIPAAQAQTTRIEGVVNVNAATAEELALLPGVGPSRAEAIIRHRTEHGPFEAVDELVEVKGIGEKALARMRAHCALSGKTTARLSPPEPGGE